MNYSHANSHKSPDNPPTNPSHSHWGEHQAEGFARHRKSLPADVVERIVAELALTPQTRVLDLGCGTGICSFSLAPFVHSVLGIDHSAAMLEHANRELVRGGHKNVSFQAADVYSLSTLKMGRFDLATICRAFFAFDKARVLQSLEANITIGGSIITIDEPNFFEQFEPWQKALRDTLRDWDPTIREPHVEVVPTSEAFRNSGFSVVKQETLTIPRNWTVESILNVLESTTLAPSQRLGTNYSKFSADLTGRLLHLHPNGVIPERARYVLHFARRPLSTSDSMSF